MGETYLAAVGKVKGLEHSAVECDLFDATVRHLLHAHTHTHINTHGMAGPASSYFTVCEVQGVKMGQCRAHSLNNIYKHRGAQGVEHILACSRNFLSYIYT